MSDDKLSLFNQRVDKCSPYVQEALVFLRSETERIGAPNAQLKVAGPGIGIIYSVDGVNFCRFDPKFLDGHEQLWAKLSPSPNAEALKATGLHVRREGKDGPWILINHIRDARKVAPLIAQAFQLMSGR